MDNLTHSLVGWTLGQAGLKSKTRKGLAALILGANLPDIDVFFGWVAWEPLATHRGFTHGLLGGVVLLPPMLAGLLYALDRWQVTRGAVFKSGLEMHFGWLLALCFLGALSHPLMDWQNSYAVQFLSPFSNLWFHNDALFIIDIWVWIGLGLSIWMSKRRERSGSARWRRPAVAALSILVLYITGNSVISAAAKRALIYDAPYAAPDAVFASPAPVVSYRRNLVWRQDGKIAYGAYNPLHDGLSWDRDANPTPDNMDDRLVRRAVNATPEISDLLNWSVLPIATVDRGACSAKVTFVDARFTRRAFPTFMRGGGAAQDGAEKRTEDQFNQSVILPLTGAGCPTKDGQP